VKSDWGIFMTWIDATDESLLDSMTAGSEDALSELIRRHRRSVLAVATRIVSSQADAEEVAQDVFLILWTRASRFRGEAQVTTWIHAIARNVAVSRRRRSRPPMLPIQLPGGAERILMSPRPDPERRAEAAELARQLLSRIGRLSAVHRAIILAILRHRSPTEAAARHGLIAGTVKSRLHRARLALRAVMPAA
jgi:RNA polymerase sigma-70 factor, ECF subfamily